MKVKKEQTELVLIAPAWQGQHWYPILLNMLTEEPILLPVLRNTLSSPKGEAHPMILNNSLHLAAWRVSGKRTRTQAFQKKLPSSSSRVWRKGTRTAYDAAWNRWASWCNQREIDPVQATVADVTEFLTNLYEDGLQYSTINGYRSAISSIHPLMEGHSVGKHPIITKIMAGVFNERPPTPKYNHTWDVNTCSITSKLKKPMTNFPSKN